jgi:hypothetical protein
LVSTTAIQLCEQLLAVLQSELDEGSVLAGGPGDRVEKVGRFAHLHLLHLESTGSLTIEDSRKIRRDLSPTTYKMRSTANLFGRSESKAIFYRDVPFGTPVSPDQPVKLTDEGLQIAKAWRERHPDE